MKEYIEREKAVGIARGYCHTIYGTVCGPDDVVELYKELKSIPAADVVEVVRCRDCAHYDSQGCADGFGWCCAFGDGHESTDNWFCADGERKGGDE